ncbi:MAG: hypothetical protein CL943_00640 [Candidatus Diapherotrites archaeon]|uniref:Uncharacterized protein n=1 Tax=Candidatus Iainarchaeum sp. TaxID=3101447 RepID=A0A2D6M079_9ARCH|nr:hypothetical protein [Candidatus Diapherotrites archaeon]|tara:strand:+ start:6647 stop:7357 length:711 start_codon:yes stop_codon:yes gene_type:complete
MTIIIGIDGLEYEYVKEFGCKDLMQKSFGKTNIEEYEEPRTIVLWSSFLAGQNLEEKIVAMGNEKMWDFALKPEETFFKHFESFKAVDVPGYNYGREQHVLEREMLKKFFAEEITVEEFDKPVFDYHRKLKEQFFEDLEKDYDLLFYYFNAADVLGHLSFGMKSKMKLIYQDMNDIAAKAAAKGEPMLILSDHGMKSVGRYGDHQEGYGFWSNSLGKDLGNPKITELAEFVANEMK